MLQGGNVSESGTSTLLLKKNVTGYSRRKDQNPVSSNFLSAVCKADARTSDYLSVSGGYGKTEFCSEKRFLIQSRMTSTSIFLFLNINMLVQYGPAVE